MSQQSFDDVIKVLAQRREAIKNYYEELIQSLDKTISLLQGSANIPTGAIQMETTSFVAETPKAEAPQAVTSEAEAPKAVAAEAEAPKKAAAPKAVPAAVEPELKQAEATFVSPAPTSGKAKGRGRPKKSPGTPKATYKRREKATIEAGQPKRGRGRPRKTPLPTEQAQGETAGNYGAIAIESMESDLDGKKLNLKDKLISIIKSEGRFLHNSEITDIYMSQYGGGRDRDKISRQISAILSFMKKDKKIEGYMEGESKKHVYWGLAEWMDAHGQIQSEHDYAR